MGGGTGAFFMFVLFIVLLLYLVDPITSGGGRGGGDWGFFHVRLVHCLIVIFSRSNLAL